MGFLARLFGSSLAVPKEPIRLDGPGSYSFPIVGEASYQTAIEAICGGRTEDGADVLLDACLIWEDSNPYDSLAIRVDVQGQTVGYLSKENARKYRKRMTADGFRGRIVICSAHIRGGWDRGKRGQGHFGVFLDLPPVG